MEIVLCNFWRTDRSILLPKRFLLYLLLGNNPQITEDGKAQTVYYTVSVESRQWDLMDQKDSLLLRAQQSWASAELHSFPFPQVPEDGWAITDRYKAWSGLCATTGGNLSLSNHHFYRKQKARQLFVWKQTHRNTKAQRKLSSSFLTCVCLLFRK